MLTWIKDDIEAGVADKARTKQPGRDRLSIGAAAGAKPLMLLNGFKIIDDRAHDALVRRIEQL